MKVLNKLKKSISLLISFFMCLLLVSSHVKATEEDCTIFEETNEYIVELKGKTVIGFNDKEMSEVTNREMLILIQHKCFLEDTFEKFKNVEIQFEYNNVWNGFALKANRRDIDKLHELDQVKTIYLANEYFLQREIANDTVNETEINDNAIENKLCTGKGVTVGIVDTGVDYWHGDLGGGIGKDADGNWLKVKKGYDYSEMSTIPFEAGFSDHGTHVAGIVAGNGEPGIAVGQFYGSGIAPEANLNVYKVFTNKRRSTRESAILMALEQAVIDKCDVVNLSLGKNFGWSNDPLSLACEQMVSHGIIVVASAGNSGERNSTFNQFPLHAPSSGLNVVSVASCNDRFKDGICFFNEQNNQHVVVGNSIVNPAEYENKKKEVYIMSREPSKESFSKEEHRNRIVMTQPTSKTITEITDMLDESFMSGLIIVNDKNYPKSYSQKINENIPISSIGKSDAEFIIEMSNTEIEPILANFIYNEKIITISAFSSQGPTPDFQLKPEITAPGTSILSCITDNRYSYMSGTSMSSPFVAGAASILKQCRPKFTVKEIRSLLINYTKPILNPLTNKEYSIYKQGAGLVNISKSLQGKMTVEPATITFNQMKKTKNVTFEIKNHFDTEQNFQIICKATNKQNIAVTVSPYSSSLKKNEKTEIQMQLELNEKTTEGYGEFWVEIISDNNPTLRIPCIFYNGNYPKMNSILRSYMFPTMAISPNGDGSCDQNTFNCLSPYNIDGIEVDVFDDNNQYIGNIFYHRGTIGAGYYSIPFFGKICGKILEDGLYTINPYILPMCKDYKNVNNWEKCLSSKVLVDTIPPEFTLDCEWVTPSEVHISGLISDSNMDVGIFLTYQFDYDGGGLVQLNEDGSFHSIIYINDEYCFIRFTAQDLAGNTSSIKKRIPFPNDTIFEVKRHYLIMK